MKDAGLLWNAKKCKIMAIKRGKLAFIDDLTLSDGSIIKCLKKDETYEFMGIPQWLKMDDIALGGDLLKIVKQRSHIIWSSDLSDINKCIASNTFVNSAVEYYFWAVKFTINVIRDMDIAFRENMNVAGCKHMHLMNVINYLPRKSGGRGLRSFEDTYKFTKIKLTINITEDDDDDERMVLVREFDRFKFFFNFEGC